MTASITTTEELLEPPLLPPEVGVEVLLPPVLFEDEEELDVFC